MQIKLYKLFVVLCDLCFLSTMPGNRKTSKKDTHDISIRMEELSERFQKEMDRFKSELTEARGVDSTAGGTGSINELSIKFSDFQKTINLDLDLMKEQISQVLSSVNDIKHAMDVNGQNYCRNKLLIYGIKEEETERSGSVLIDKVVNILNSRLGAKGIVVDRNQISDCWRYGRKRGGSKSRPVLLEFTQIWNRNNVYFNKSVFKGAGVIISELLTGSRYAIYREAKKRHDKNCWTVNGKIFVCVDGVKSIIHKITELGSV